MKSTTVLPFALGLGLLVACGPPPVPRTGGGGGSRDASGGGNPLGPSYVLISLPTEDDSLLGRILPAQPQAGRSLEETARANPCADKLSEVKTTPLSNTFEDAQEVSASAKAKAMLGAFGFSGDVDRATHFVYKLETSKRTARNDTTDYDACCRAKGCGYGYVSALIYGEGEYATGEETRGSASVDVVTVGSASGSANVKILHKRKVKGWIAAVVTVTDAGKQSSEQLGPLGVAQAAGITEASISETTKVLYEKDKMSVVGGGNEYAFKDGRGIEITENEFVRRYRDMTGSTELDDVWTRRNNVSFYLSGTLTALSAGALVFGILNSSRHCQSSDYDPDYVKSDDCAVSTGGTFPKALGYDRNATTTNDGGITLAVAGGVGTVAFGIWFLIAALHPDGGVHDHFLSDHDATLYSDKYNRALLRRTIKQVQKAHADSGIRVVPLISPTSFGLGATF